MFCTQCGNANDTAAKFCSSCGFELTQNGQAGTYMQPGTKALNSQDEFYRAMIGPKNQAYYMKYFQRFDDAGNVGITWHWPAFFVTFYWLLYRKMWLAAAIYLFLPYLIILPVAAIDVMIGKPDENLFAGLSIVAYFGFLFILYPLYANALYYKHCIKKIKKVAASSESTQKKIHQLASMGGISYGPLILIFLVVGGILAAIAIPAYQDYKIRSRMAEVVSIGNAAAETVSNYIYEHQEIPISLEHAGFDIKGTPSVKEIKFNSESGVINITVGFTPIEGKSLLFDPYLDENNKILWDCISQDIPEKYLPRECGPTQ